MRRVNWWFWLPLIGGALLRLAWIWTQPLWYDENFTLAVARLPLADMWTAIRGDVHPPLYYLLISPIAHLDLPAWTLRLPSVLMGIVSLPFCWSVFGKLASDRVRNVAFAFVCLGGSAGIFYTQEARMYGLLTLLLMAAAWALFSRRWVWLAILSTLLLYTQDYALLYIPSLWLAGMAYDRTTWKRLTLALVLAGIAYLPWMPVLFQQQASLASGYWIPPLTPGVALSDLYRSIVQKGTFRFEIFGLVTMFGWGAYAACWHLVHGHGRGRTALLLAIGTWSLAILGSLILGTSIMHQRSLVMCSPFVFLWLTYPLVEVPLPPIVQTNKSKRAYAELVRLQSAREHLLVVRMLGLDSVRPILSSALQEIEKAIFKVRREEDAQADE